MFKMAPFPFDQESTVLFMLYDSISAPNAKEQPARWDFEEVPLRGDILFTVLCNDEGRGSIQTRSGEEATTWRKILSHLKAEPPVSGR